MLVKDVLSVCHCHTTFVSCISMSRECSRPLPPTHRHVFCGLEEPAEREGEPRATAGAERPLNFFWKKYIQSINLSVLLLYPALFVDDESGPILSLPS